MNEKGAVKYELSDHRPLPWQTISRQAVADAIVAQLNDASFFGRAPFITR